MVVFRPHRSGFDEAMKEVKYFSSKEEMLKSVADDFKQAYQNRILIDVNIDEKEVADTRNGWIHSQYVIIRYASVIGNNESMIYGICDCKTFDCNTLSSPYNSSSLWLLILLIMLAQNKLQQIKENNLDENVKTENEKDKINSLANKFAEQMRKSQMTVSEANEICEALKLKIGLKAEALHANSLF